MQLARESLADPDPLATQSANCPKSSQIVQTKFMTFIAMCSCYVPTNTCMDSPTFIVDHFS